MSKNRTNYQGTNNGTQAQEVNTTPESNQEQFEGEIPMDNPKKPEKPAEKDKKGVKQAAKEAWETEHTITWSGKGVAKKVGGFLAAAAAGALAMWAWDRKSSGASDDEDDYEDDDVVCESDYREVSDTEA